MYIVHGLLMFAVIFMAYLVYEVRPHMPARGHLTLLVVCGITVASFAWSPAAPSGAEEPPAATPVEVSPATAPIVYFVDGDCDSFFFIAKVMWPEINTPRGPSWSWVKTQMRQESHCTSSPVILRNGRDVGNDRNSCGQQSWGILQLQFKLVMKNGVCVDVYWNVPMRTGFGPLNVECGIVSKQELLNPAVNFRCAGRLYAAFGPDPWE